MLRRLQVRVLLVLVLVAVLVPAHGTGKRSAAANADSIDWAPTWPHPKYKACLPTARILRTAHR